MKHNKPGKTQKLEQELDALRRVLITPEIVPLRRRPKLIGHRVDHFVAVANRMRKPLLRVSAVCLEKLSCHPFPSSIRELHNLIRLLSVAADEDALPGHLPSQLLSGGETNEMTSPLFVSQEQEGNSEFRAPAMSSRRLKEQVKDFERAPIDNAFDRPGSKRKADRAPAVDIGAIPKKIPGGQASPRRY